MPEVPVVVVKDNERLSIRHKTDGQSRGSQENYVFSNENNDFYFADESFNGTKHPVGTANKFELYTFSFIGNRTAAAFNNNAISQRDYVYYNILNPGDQGPLDMSYAETVCGIVFDPNSVSYIDDDPFTDWADGAFEFQLDVLQFAGSNALDRVSKILSVPRDIGYFTSSETIWYPFPNPSAIKPWDMKKNGDTWKYVLNEIDNGGDITVNYSSSTKIGSNFTFDASAGTEYKVSTGFGSSVEQTFTSGISFVIKQNSDFCGEAIVNYMSPVIIGSNIKKGMVGPAKYYVAEVNTGIARLLIFPRPIQ